MIQSLTFQPNQEFSDVCKAKHFACTLFYNSFPLIWYATIKTTFIKKFDLFTQPKVLRVGIWTEYVLLSVTANINWFDST